MTMRTLATVLLLGAMGVTARADKLGGFSGIDKPYLVNQDRVCRPLVVQNGTATGLPKCEKQTADVVAKLDMKTPVVQSGAKATFAATSAGRTLTITKEGNAVVTWDAPDPIGKVVAVYANKYEDRIGVEYTARVAGKDVTNVVAFDLIAAGKTPPTTTPPTTTPTTTPPTTPPTTPAAPEDPKVAKAVAAAKAAAKGKQLAAWQAVLALDAAHSEALYRVAQQQMAAKKPADALTQLKALAASSKPDAIEWLIEARFDPAFASLRGDAAFRAATGLDRKAATPYERIMGLGGKWEQTGTACDKATVVLEAFRDRNFKLRVKTACQGSTFDHTWKGTWQVDGTGLKLVVPTKGQEVTDKDAMVCKFEPKGDEDQLHCFIGRDLDFVVLPTRR